MKQSERRELEEAQALIGQARSTGTKALYAKCWQDFEDFCQWRRLVSLPADKRTVILYLAKLSHEQSPSTIQVKLSAISRYHVEANYVAPSDWPEVKSLMSGIRRKLRRMPTKKEPVTLEDLRDMVESLPDDLAGARDRAILLIGWAGAFRRSELSALHVEDIHWGHPVRFQLRHSKTDQEGEGKVKFIDDDPAWLVAPINALKKWLGLASIQTGPAFVPVDQHGHLKHKPLAGRYIADVVKRACALVGKDPSQFGGHSLRRGFISAAASAGVLSRDIMAQTGHESEAVMRGYIQDEGVGALRALKGAMQAGRE